MDLHIQQEQEELREIRLNRAFDKAFIYRQIIVGKCIRSLQENTGKLQVISYLRELRSVRALWFVGGYCSEVSFSNISSPDIQEQFHLANL
jgi:hypothetical protein